MPVKNPSTEVHHEVMFDFDKLDLKPAEIEKIEEFFNTAFKDKRLFIALKSWGMPMKSVSFYNLVLSEKRAKAIGVLLKGKGIKVDKVYIEGRGEAASNRPNWQNRKVDVVVKLEK